MPRLLVKGGKSLQETSNYRYTEIRTALVSQSLWDENICRRTAPRNTDFYYPTTASTLRINKNNITCMGIKPATTKITIFLSAGRPRPARSFRFPVSQLVAFCHHCLLCKPNRILI